MKLKFFLFVFFGFFICHASFTQSSLRGESRVSLLAMEELIKIAPSQAASFGNEQIKSSNTGVYLQQIGDGNSVTADISSNQIGLQLTQQGNDNFSGIWATAQAVEGNLVQNGNSNFAFDFADDPSLGHSLNLSQNGNGHHFESYGTNSIGNKLEFNMSGNSEMIIVRNFK